MASLDYDNLEDPRDVELSSLAAIYPEIQQVRPGDPYTIALDIPVTPSTAVIVFFPATSEAETPAGPGDPAGLAGPADPAQRRNAPAVDSHELAHLPSLHLEIVFGPSYPAEQPPRVTVSTTPPWLPAETVRKLEDDGPRLWEEMGRDMVGFTYIDHVQQSAEDVFGLVGDRGALEVDPQHKIAILDYDIRARHAAFEKETFNCGVCLDPKKGSVCHKMLDCGHVFCVSCLQDFYNNAIKEGDLASVRCLAPNCAKERATVKETSPSGKKRKKPKTFINPSELLQIPLDQDVVKRYVTLKYKTELESDKNTIYCPRQWCNGAARSKKHRKPQGLELVENSDDSASDDDEDNEDGTDDAEGGGRSKKSKPYKTATDLLAICEDCGFAFCSRCFQSWHGEFFRCYPRREKGELTAEEQASLDYMKLHTTPCPTCAAPAQKTHGCNHMICGRCQSHFCYLCSAWLDPGNPYQHFNEAPGGRVTGCYMRLWELEQGDGDDVGYGFEGGVIPRAPAALAEPPHAARDLVPEIEEPDDDDGEVDIPELPEFARLAGPVAWQGDGILRGEVGDGGQVGIAREGPLVLRIAANLPAGAGRGGPRGRAPARPGRGGEVGGGANQQPVVGGRGAGGRGRGGRGGGILGQRGRGAHGGGAPPGPALHRRQNNQVNQVQRRNNINNQNNGNEPLPEDGDLDPVQQAWIRQFVELALNDEEDMLLDWEDHHFVLFD